MLHIFLCSPAPASTSAAGPRPRPSRRTRRWPFTIKCNYFCNIHLQLPLPLPLLLPHVAGVAATSCLAYFRLPQRPGDRVIKVNLVTIYRHICFCCRCLCCCSRCRRRRSCSCSCTWVGPNDPVVICCCCCCRCSWPLLGSSAKLNHCRLIDNRVGPKLPCPALASPSLPAACCLLCLQPAAPAVAQMSCIKWAKGGTE